MLPIDTELRGEYSSIQGGLAVDAEPAGLPETSEHLTMNKDVDAGDLPLAVLPVRRARAWRGGGRFCRCSACSCCSQMRFCSTGYTPKNKTWKRGEKRPSCRTGIALSALRGVDLAGHPLTLPNTNKRTLLLVFSTSCEYCEANWPNWRRLIREKPGGLDVALIDVSSTVNSGYLARHGVLGYPVMRATEPQTVVLYRLGPTPQTVLIEPGGVIGGVWTGGLRGRGMKEVEAGIRAIAQ